MSRRLVRIISVLRKLESGGHVTLEDLSADLNVSRRTLFRDLNSLKQAGFEVRFDSGAQAYRRDRADAPHASPPAHGILDILMAAATTLLPGVNTKSSRYTSAEAALLAALPEKLQIRYRDFKQAVHPETTLGERSRRIRKSIDTILDAIQDQRCILLHSFVVVPGESARAWIVRPFVISYAESRWVLNGVAMPSHREISASLASVSLEACDYDEPGSNQSTSTPPSPSDDSRGKIVIE